MDESAVASHFSNRINGRVATRTRTYETGRQNASIPFEPELHLLRSIKKKLNSKKESHHSFYNLSPVWELKNKTQTAELSPFIYSYVYISGPASSVGIATGNGLDGQGNESRWGRDFPHPSRPALGPTQPTVQWVPVLSRR